MSVIEFLLSSNRTLNVACSKAAMSRYQLRNPETAVRRGHCPAMTLVLLKCRRSNVGERQIAVESGIEGAHYDSTNEDTYYEIRAIHNRYK